LLQFWRRKRSRL